MSQANPPGGRTLSIEQLAELREKTDAISQHIQGQLAAHLETIRSLLSPRWVLGTHVEAGEGDVLPGADRAFDRLIEEYQTHHGRPFSLPRDLQGDPIKIDERLDLHPWEYKTVVGEEGKEVTVTAPLRWVLNYRSGYSPGRLREHVVERKNLDRDDAQRFVVSSLVLKALFEKYEGLRNLLRDLRFTLHTEPYDGLGELPLVSISSCVPSFRPADDVVLQATKFSGVPAFIEVVDTEAVKSLDDPIRAKIEEILG
jgi:hypothetical protein